MHWQALRQHIYERDHGICAVCHKVVPLERYECGHIVDRCAGGADEAENLVVTCYACNRLKPVHETADAYRLDRKRAIVDQDENELYSAAELKALGISQRDRRRLAALHTQHAELNRDEAVRMVLEG